MLPFLLSSYSPPPPHLVKTSHSSFNRYLSCSKSDSRGYRNEMEDACIAKIQLMNGFGFFSVMDGHGGTKTSRILSKLLPGIFVSPPKSEKGVGQKLLLDIQNHESIQKAYLQLDKKICKTLRNKDVSGSTCVSLCVIYKKELLSGAKNTETLETKNKSIENQNNQNDSSKNDSENNLSKKAVISNDLNGELSSNSNGKLGLNEKLNDKNEKNDSHVINGNKKDLLKEDGMDTPTRKKHSPGGKKSDLSGKSPNSHHEPNISHLSSHHTHSHPHNTHNSEIGKSSLSKPHPFKTQKSKSTIEKIRDLKINVDDDDSDMNLLINDKMQPVNKILKYQLICLNVGDSRCVLYYKMKTFPLSFDHKPPNPKEKLRITKAGYEVSMGRVDGMLAVSRAFGDEQFKQMKHISREKQAVVATPEIIEKEIEINEDNLEYNFAVLACDGVYDCMTNEEVTQFVYEHLVKYEIWNEDVIINHLDYLPNRGWYYTHIQNWTSRQVIDFKETLAPQLQDLFPQKKSFNGNDFIEWLNNDVKRSKGTSEKMKKLYKYVTFTEEKINRFLNRLPARTTAEKLQTIAENLIDECILHRGSQDNCTATIVLFHHPSWVNKQIQRAKEEKQTNNSQISTPMNYTEFMSPSKTTTPSNTFVSPKNRIRTFKKEIKSPYNS